MRTWKMEVFLTRRLRNSEYEHIRAIPGMTGVSSRTGDPNDAIVIEAEAQTRAEAETLVRTAAETVVAATEIARVGGADDTMQNRQLLLWVRATRHQLRRWEIALAAVVAADLTGGPKADGHQIWDVQIHRHLALVAANNLVRAIDNADGRFSSFPDDLTTDIRNQRDIQEHWDEQWPAFYSVDSPGPLRRGGVIFAQRHPDWSPFSFLGWSSDGPLLGPGLALEAIEGHLSVLEAEVIATAPQLASFLTDPPPSPWLQAEARTPDYRWWPRQPQHQSPMSRDI